MNKFYFTFGSDENYPYQNTYLIVVALTLKKAIEVFQKKYPNRQSGAVNCAFWYTEKEWDQQVSLCYEGVEPADVIWADECWGPKPEGFRELYLFIPDDRKIILVQSGDGDLEDDDFDKGYVDSVSYTMYDMEMELTDEDGGDMLLPVDLADAYSCLADCIPDLLHFIFGDPFKECRILA